jgi:hypothetical protein
VIGTMDFFTTDVLDELSDGRADALRNAVLQGTKRSSQTGQAGIKSI